MAQILGIYGGDWGQESPSKYEPTLWFSHYLLWYFAWGSYVAGAVYWTIYWLEETSISSVSVAVTEGLGVIHSLNVPVSATKRLPDKLTHICFGGDLQQTWPALQGHNIWDKYLKHVINNWIVLSVIAFKIIATLTNASTQPVIINLTTVPQWFMFLWDGQLYWQWMTSQTSGLAKS